MNPNPILIPPIDWQVIAPFLWLVIGALVVTLMAAGPQAVRRLTGPAALVALVPSAAATWSLIGRATEAPAETFGGMVVMDPFSICFHFLFLATAALTLLISLHETEGEGRSELHCLVLFAASGMMLMSASSHLLVLFLGLEVLSLPLYVLVGFARRLDRSLEASMKYFLLGAFSTGFTIYGMALLYGATGTLDLSRVASLTMAGVAEPTRNIMLLSGFGLTLVGFLFKIAAFPFHYWLPDVYQGAPTTVTAFMVAGTKAASFAAVLRVVTAPFLWEGPVTIEWTRLLTVLAALTMTAGNLVALVQGNLKRMLAYSSIAHAGYLLVAVVTHSGDGVASVIYYLAAYLFMNLGAFAVLLAVDRSRGGTGEGETLAAFAGLGRRQPWLAAAMTLFMLSLTGVPLTAGFLGKFYIFKAAIDAQLYGLAIVGLLNSAVAAAYYLNVVLTMYMKEPVKEPPRVLTPATLAAGILISAAGVVYLGLFPSRVMTLASSLLL